MAEKTIESISVRRLEILDEKGEADSALMPSLSDDTIRKMYELLILSRIFDERALNLQREGRIGTYAPISGQEASQVGSACALERSDWIFPSFREMGVHIAIGYPIHMLFQYWAGDERGMITPADLNIFPICLPVGTHIPHATGAAFAAKFKGDRTAVIAYFGDGATSKGDFHEGLNMAGDFKLPVVFICQNNQWAISVPRGRQSASKTLAQKACSYGFEGIQVDGNDIFAVYKATKDAVEKAKNGGGPTLIECLTYRMSHHTTADDATRYRNEDEVASWKPKDPILRLKLFLEKKGIWTEQYQKEVEDKSKTVVDNAVITAESIKPSQPGDLVAYTCETLTPRQTKQMMDF